MRFSLDWSDSHKNLGRDLLLRLTQHDLKLSFEPLL